MNPKVDFFFQKASQWQEAYSELRSLLLDTELTEELKWGCPCYTTEKGNVVLIHGFKTYCALLFMQGALLKDEQGLLIQQTENVQAARQLRFTSADEIVEKSVLIKDFVQQAIVLNKAGEKLVLKKTTEFNMPEAFKQVLDEMPELESAFKALTPGRQRAYLLFFSAPKQVKTQEARIEKCIPLILDGKGLND